MVKLFGSRTRKAAETFLPVVPPPGALPGWPQPTLGRVLPSGSFRNFLMGGTLLTDTKDTSLQGQYDSQEVLTYLSYIVGYRTWQFQTIEGVPHLSGYRGTVWPLYEPLEAQFVPPGPGFHSGEPPYPGPQAGIHALNDAQSARTSLIFGGVALWGRVEHHTTGYRAQYAYPLWLCSPLCHHCATVSTYSVDLGEQTQFLCRGCTERVVKQIASTPLNQISYHQHRLLEAVYPKIVPEGRFIRTHIVESLAERYSIPIKTLEEHNEHRNMGKDNGTDAPGESNPPETREAAD